MLRLLQQASAVCALALALASTSAAADQPQAPSPNPSPQARAQTEPQRPDGDGVENMWLARINAFSTVMIALVTVALAIITWQQKTLTDRALRSTHAIERAYVTMSHHPPGLMISSMRTHSWGPGVDMAETVERQEAKVRIGVKNWGILRHG